MRVPFRKAALALSLATAAPALAVPGAITPPPAAPIPQSTFASLPSAATAGAGKLYEVTDVGIGGSLWVSDGSSWNPAAPITLCRQNAATSFTTASTTTQFSCTIPANVITGHRLAMDCLWTNTANATAKTFRVRLATTNILSRSSTSTSTAYRGNAVIVSRSSSAQVAAPGTLDGGVGTAAAAVVTGAVDTTLSQTATCDAINPSAGDTITLEAGEGRLLP